MNIGTLIERVIDAVLARTRYQGFYLYRVAFDNRANKVRLLRVGDAGGLDDAIDVDKLYGSHGIMCESAVGTLVLLGFRDGDKAYPYVAFYYPQLPETITIDANSLIQIGTTDAGHAPGLQVRVGSTNRQPVARKDDATGSGTLVFTPGVGIVTIAWTPEGGGSPVVVGTLAATSLVFTPDPGSGGMLPLPGKIKTGSDLLSSE